MCRSGAEDILLSASLTGNPLKSLGTQATIDVKDKMQHASPTTTSWKALLCRNAHWNQDRSGAEYVTAPEPWPGILLSPTHTAATPVADSMMFVVLHWWSQWASKLMLVFDAAHRAALDSISYMKPAMDRTTRLDLCSRTTIYHRRILFRDPLSCSALSLLHCCCRHLLLQLDR